MNLLCIGGGNMATALIGGLLKSKASVRHIHIMETNRETHDQLRLRFASDMQSSGIDFSVHDRDCPSALFNDVDHTWVLLAVKPQDLRKACEQAPPGVRKLLVTCHLLSIAAGISIASISSWCNGNRRIVRAMPNTPALIAQGITGAVAASNLNDKARAQADQLLRALGQTIWLQEEKLMNAVTALSGSGPAYVFRFIEALTAAGVQIGLSQNDAAAFTFQTVKGAVSLLESSGETPQTLREKVTSKGGTTAAALASLEQDHFMEIIASALHAATQRAATLDQQAT